MRQIYASVLSQDPRTVDDLREAVTTLEDVERTARRVFGGTHPLAMNIEDELRDARAALHARETPGSFQRANEEKLRTRRIVSVADRFRRSAAATRPTPRGDGSRSTSRPPRNA